MNGKDSCVTRKLSDVEQVKVHGRTTTRRDPLTLFWTGSAVEFNVTGSELWVEFEVDYETYEPWISVVINGASVSRQMLVRGRYWVCVFRGMNSTVAKNIRVVKDVQPMSADTRSVLQVHGVKSDGEFLPVADKLCSIEFIGDSITSGEGAIGAKSEEDWIPMWFSATYNYASLTAQTVNADYRIISQSGWGVLTSWDNNPHGNIPDCYEKVCGVLAGERNAALGAFDDYDFSTWQPHVVVVNLGSNDGGAFHSPEWRDEATGETHKQRLNEDGTYHREDLAAFEAAAVEFLVKLRRYNPQAHIVWAYGMLGMPMMPAIYRAVDAYEKNSGDRHVSIFQLPDTTDETIGARRHPGALAHARAADELAGYIKRLLA